jgi:hypothetical protein
MNIQSYIMDTVPMSFLNFLSRENIRQIKDEKGLLNSINIIGVHPLLIPPPKILVFYHLKY